MRDMYFSALSYYPFFMYAHTFCIVFCCIQFFNYISIVSCAVCVGFMKPRQPRRVSEIELETGAGLTCEERKRNSGNPILHMWL